MKQKVGSCPSGQRPERLGDGGGRHVPAKPIDLAGVRRIVSTLPFLCLCACGVAQEAPPMMLGAQTHLGHGRMQETPARLQQAELGLGFVRDEIYWATVEPKAGVFDWTETDRRLQAIHAAGAKLLLTVNWSNPAYDTGPVSGRLPANGIALPDTPEERAAFSRYVMAVLDRYADPHSGRWPGLIMGIEVWNEANGSWGGGYTPDAVAGPLTELTLDVARAVRSKTDYASLPIAGCAAVGTSPRYVLRCLEAGMGESVEAIAVHPYEDVDTAFQNLVALRAMLDAKGLDHVAVWATEYAAFDQPDQVLKLLAAMRTAGVELASHYPAEDFDGMSGLIDAAGKIRPAGLTFRAYARRLAWARPIGRVVSQPGTYVLAFEELGGRRAWVAWSEIGSTQIVLKGEARLARADGVAQPVPGRVQLGREAVWIEGADEAQEDLQGAILLADSKADFPADAVRSGDWTYLAVQNGLAPLPLKRTPDDWGERAEDACCPFLSVAAGGMHPGARDGQPVTAVRRWTSPVSGRIRLLGWVSRGEGGDGTSLEIRQGDKTVWGRVIAPGSNADLDLQLDVRAGEAVDFAVSPGASANIDFDALQMRFALYAGSAARSLVAPAPSTSQR